MCPVNAVTWLGKCQSLLSNKFMLQHEYVSNSSLKKRKMAEGDFMRGNRAAWTSNHRNHTENAVPGDKFPSHINLDGLSRFAPPSSRLFQREMILAGYSSTWSRDEAECGLYTLIKAAPVEAGAPKHLPFMWKNCYNSVLFRGPIASVWVIRGVQSAKTFVIIQWTSRTGFATMNVFKKEPCASTQHLWLYSQPAARFGAAVGLGSGRFWGYFRLFPILKLKPGWENQTKI